MHLKWFFKNVKALTFGAKGYKLGSWWTKYVWNKNNESFAHIFPTCECKSKWINPDKVLKSDSLKPRSFKPSLTLTWIRILSPDSERLNLSQRVWAGLLLTETVWTGRVNQIQGSRINPGSKCFKLTQMVWVWLSLSKLDLLVLRFSSQHLHLVFHCIVGKLLHSAWSQTLTEWRWTCRLSLWVM